MVQEESQEQPGCKYFRVSWGPPIQRGPNFRPAAVVFPESGTPVRHLPRAALAQSEDLKHF